MKKAIAVVVAAAFLAAAPAAGAQVVTGGKTVFKPDPDTFEGFADMSISVGATGAAVDARNGVKFPISGGEVGEGPEGTIDHRGGLVFAHNVPGGETVKFAKFRIRITNNKTKLFAKSGGSVVRFLDLDLSDANISGDPGSRLRIKGAEAALAKPAAEVMSDAFDFPFRKGIPFGSMNVKAELSG
jgi:hypothetical protein